MSPLDGSATSPHVYLDDVLVTCLTHEPSAVKLYGKGRPTQFDTLRYHAPIRRGGVIDMSQYSPRMEPVTMLRHAECGAVVRRTGPHVPTAAVEQSGEAKSAPE